MEIKDSASSPAAFAPVESPSDVPAQSNKTSRKRVWLSLLALCCIGCVAVGVYLFVNQQDNRSPQTIISQIQQTPGFAIQLTIKRESLKYRGQNSATIFVVPRTDAPANTLAFDATMSLNGANATIETYSLISNRAYFSTSREGVIQTAQCLNPSQVPPLSLLQASLTTSTTSVESTQLEGSSDPNCVKQSKGTFAGESYILCKNAAGDVRRIIGDDVELNIEPIANPTQIPAITIPRTSNSSPLVCPSLPTPVAPKLTELALESTQELTTLRESSCGCKGEKKPCLFVHGLGEIFAHDMSNTFPFYWGNIHEHAPCCTSIKFVHFDTINRGWNTPSLQQDFCNAALQVSKGAQGNTIGKLILVAHSMGNLIAGAAVASGKCKMTPDLTWVHLGGPMKGSMAANLFQEKCTEGGWNTIIKAPLTFFGVCPPTEGPKSLLHQSTVNQNQINNYLAAQRVRAQFVTKAACGISSFGLNTIYSGPFDIIGKWAKHNGDNDGVVDFDSCAAGLNTGAFGASTSNSFYKASLNHVDLTFRNGDGWWGDDRKPIKWFECAL